MKKLQIMVEDELMSALKIHAFQNNTSLKDVVTDIIKNRLGQTHAESIQPVNKTYTKPKEVYTKPKPEPTVEVRPVFEAPKQASSFDQKLEEILNEESHHTYYTLRKTDYLGPKEKEDGNKYNGIMIWFIPKGAKQHFDKDGGMIPYRYTLPNGKINEPTKEELAEISDLYGMPVVIEE